MNMTEGEMPCLQIFCKGDTTEVGLGGSVVTRLARDLVRKSYHIFTDNFFPSPSLYRDLLLKDIYYTGTLHSNRRNFPPDFKDVAKSPLLQALSQLDDTYFGLLQKEVAGLRLMVTDGTTVWTGTLSATELSSTASEASMEAGEFIQEAESAT